ncbi:sodium-dependent glucose transporter 1A-like [Lingula anatina]|uniref:Sodium-dependent glucose transporter 1A-like n=1 Tax=Lingula anatina TaxID=7574 RepID=A0A1S3I3R0_LINAN|nr:sodium-dependent glucose transporter 1A-like [Lingula anatina]|eukprot:XP_013392873.1 sodium-dependent glucose transporter 1A-like [Lingula anatina]
MSTTEPRCISAAVGKDSCRCSKGRRYTTVSLCISFLALGTCIAIPGPTLIDLREQVQTSVESITYAISGRSAGSMVGSILGGFLYDHMNHHLFLSVIMILTCVVTVLIPFTKHLSWLAVCLALQGVTTGCLDTGGSALCVNIWGKENGPYMQALHFTFGIGALLAPVIAEPFLSKRMSIGDNETSTWILPNDTSVGHGEDESLSRNNMASVAMELPNDTALSIHDDNRNETLILNTREMWTETDIAYAYIVTATLLLCSGGLFMVTCIQEQSCFSWKRQDAKKRKGSEAVRNDPIIFKGVFLVLMAFFYLLYVGLELSFSALVTTFGFRILNWPKPKAAHLTTVFWGLMSTSRGFSILLSKFVSSTIMIATDLALIVVAMLLLTFLIGKHEIVMWLCTALYGLGMGSLFAAGISWAERYIHVTGKTTIMFYVGSCVGKLGFPPIFGYFFPINGMYFVYIMLGGAIGKVCLFLILYVLAHKQGERYIPVCQKQEDLDNTLPISTTKL